MSIYVVSRFETANITQFLGDEVSYKTLEFITPEIISSVKEGDVFLGVFPLRIAAQICALGGRVLNVKFNIPAELVGKPLTQQQVLDFGGQVFEYQVTRVNRGIKPGEVRVCSDFYLAGLTEWLEDMGFELTPERSQRFSPAIEQVKEGETVVGAFLPHQAAQIIDKGADFVDFDLTDIPAHLRDQQDELDADQLDELRARLTHYDVVESLPTDSFLEAL